MWTCDDRESQVEGASSTKVLRKKWAGGLGKQPGCRKAREASRRARLTGYEARWARRRPQTVSVLAGHVGT